MPNLPSSNENNFIVLINFDENDSLIINNCNFHQRQLLHFNNVVEMIASWEDKKFDIVAVISKSEILGKPF